MQSRLSFKFAVPDEGHFELYLACTNMSDFNEMRRQARREKTNKHTNNKHKSNEASMDAHIPSPGLAVRGADLES